MASATTTSYDAALKELWPMKRMNNLVYAGAPFLAMVPKGNKEFDGDALNVPIQYANPMGRSSAFATAQSNAQPSGQEKFVLTRVNDHHVFTIDNELILASKKDSGAVVSALDNESKSAISQLGRSLHQKLYGDGTGSIGTIGALAAGNLTLANVQDVVNFEVGQFVVGAATAAGALRDSGNAAQISAVNRDTGVLSTAGGDWDVQISGLLPGDFLFTEGDAQNAGSAVCVSGLGAWLPTSAPGATPFFGVDRTTDTVRLGGVRYDGSSDGTVREALMNGGTRLSREGTGAKATHIFMNTDDYGRLIIEQDSKGLIPITEKIGDIGFDGFRIHTGAGMQKVFEDFQCPVGFAYMLRLDTFKWWSLGGGVGGTGIHMDRSDGTPARRQANADGLEFRAKYYGQLGCDAPGWNAVITLPS